MGLGVWIFNVLFVLAIFVQAYAEANKESIPEEVIEMSRWNMLIIFLIFPILIAIVF